MLLAVQAAEVVEEVLVDDFLLGDAGGIANLAADQATQDQTGNGAADKADRPATNEARAPISMAMTVRGRAAAKPAAVPIAPPTFRP